MYVFLGGFWLLVKTSHVKSWNPGIVVASESYRNWVVVEFADRTSGKYDPNLMSFQSFNTGWGFLPPPSDVKNPLEILVFPAWFLINLICVMNLIVLTKYLGESYGLPVHTLNSPILKYPCDHNSSWWWPVVTGKGSHPNLSPRIRTIP